MELKRVVIDLWDNTSYELLELFYSLACQEDYWNVLSEMAIGLKSKIHKFCK